MSRWFHVNDGRVRLLRVILKGPARPVNVSCTNCGKKYVLSDDKVAGKASVKIRCKQCQSLISIDVAQASVGGGSASSPPHASRGSGAVAMAAVQQPTRSPWEDEATKAMPALDMSAQWHAMIAGVQQGPFDVKTLMGKVAAGEVTLRTYLWKAGMGDWKRASDLPEVSSIFAGSNAAAAPSSSPSGVSKPVTRNSQAVARKDVAVANEMPSPEVTKPRGGNVADPLPTNQLGTEPMPAATRPSGVSRPQQVAQPQPEPTPQAEAPQAEAKAEQPLNDLFGDISQPEHVPGSGPSGLIETPSQQAAQPKSGEVDPFAALGEASDAELPPPGEATKFFIAQAGVNKRNPPWKIALFALSLIGLPTSVLYLLSTFKVVELPKVTRTTEDGQEVQESFFSAGGVTGLKDILTGDAKKRKQEAEQREKERLAALAAAKARAIAANTAGGQAPEEDDPTPTKPVNPKMAADYAMLDDPNKTTKGPRDREKNPNLIATSGLKDDVAAKVVADNVKGFNLCIENALRRNPNLQVGAITVALTVGASGAVKSATITPKQHEGSDWGACIVQSGKRIVFPASDGESEVQVPLKVGVSM